MLGDEWVAQFFAQYPARETLDLAYVLRPDAAWNEVFLRVVQGVQMRLPETVLAARTMELLAWLASEGASFRELLGNVKMMRALTLLQTSPLGVAQVAYAVGYESPARFAAKFRAHFGCTPSDVRKAA